MILEPTDCLVNEEICDNLERISRVSRKREYLKLDWSCMILKKLLNVDNAKN